ncbi:MAG: YceI family protein [Thermoleophilaceae bacterium]
MQTGTHTVGPGEATLQVKTYREGMAAKAGHDLIIEVTSWNATVEVGEGPDELAVELSADPGSLEVRDGHGGAKPLNDKDRADIRKSIDDKVLKGQAVTFRSTGVEGDDGGPVSMSGEVSMAGETRPVSFQLEIGSDGKVDGTVPLTQSEWGIKPYKGLMGALKVRDDVEVVLDGRLPPG